MEKLKEKHNHKLTDLIKVGIFSLVIMAPFISIGVRCGYVMWNKNAKDSYSGTYDISYKYQSNEVNTIDDLVVGNIYTFDKTNATLSNSNIYICSITACYNINFNGSFYLDEQTTSTNMYLLTKSNLLYIQGGWEFPVSNRYIYFVYRANFNADYIECVSKCDTSNIPINSVSLDGTLDNAFSYSVSQISNDPVFNWTRNTGIYQPINAMVQGLEIENDTLQILLAYWSLMTAVYIVFDLIIFCFTKITHFING